MRRARQRQHGQTAREYRRDGGIRAGRQEAVGAEKRETDATGGEGVQPRLRRHARQMRGRQLLGDGDGGQ